MNSSSSRLLLVARAVITDSPRESHAGIESLVSVPSPCKPTTPSLKPAALRASPNKP